MLTLDDLRGAIHGPSGTSAFAVTLGDVADIDGPGVTIAASYTSMLGSSATAANLTAPTGALGLGWHLPIERIVAIYPPGASMADPQFVLTMAGGGALLLRAVSIASNQIRYIADPYKYWLVTRYVTEDRWEIVREDGRRWIYGESNAGHGTVETGVHWGDFRGSSVASGQQTFALAWNLSRVVDSWGNTFTWIYRQVTKTLGGTATFTQATYFDRIVGPGLDYAVFTYAPKTPAEYELHHTTPPPPNAWQDRVEMEYLASIDFCSPGDSYHTAVFDYTDGQGNTIFLGSGSTTKRLLMGVARQLRGADGQPVPQTIPQTRFTYVTDSTRPGYGCIATVVPPAGGTSTYAYSATAPLPLCTRSIEIDPPAIGNGVTCSSPRFWFAEQYVVVAWERSDGNAEIVAYCWEGRWLPSLCGTVAAADSYAYAAIQVAIADRGFAVVAGAQCLSCSYDPAVIGFPLGTLLSLTLNQGEPVKVVAGDGFAAALGTQSGNINRIRWTGTTWEFDTIVLGSGATGLRCAVNATAGAVISCWTIATPSGGPLNVRVDRYDATCAWQVSTGTVPRGGTTVASVDVHAGDTHAVVVARSSAAGQATARYSAVTWSADYATLANTTLMSVTATTTPVPVLRGSCVAIGTTLFRFDGTDSWSRQDLGAASAIDVGVDQAIVTTGAGAAVAYTVFVYDPNQTSVNRWSSPANLTAITPGVGYRAAAARATAAGSRWIIAPVVSQSANALWCQAPDSTWSATRIADTLSPTELPSFQVLGERYAIYQSGGNTTVLLLDDGVATAAPALTGERILVPNQPPDLLVGESSFVTYTGTFNGVGSTLRLRRPIRGAVDGAITALSVASITQTTGYESEPGANGTLVIACSFTTLNATVDRSGWMAQYNLTETAEGVDGNAQPFGYTAVSYFNGLTAVDLENGANALQPAPSSDNDSSVSTAPGLYQGAPYSVRSFAANAVTPEAETESGWTPILVAAPPYAFRVPRETTVRRGTDGVTQTDQTTWNATNGFPARRTTTSYDCNGVAQIAAMDYRYFVDQYRHPELNLLDQVVQQTCSTNGATTSSGIRTWSNSWGSDSVWAPFELYVATNAQPATFNRWDAGNAPLAAGWLLCEQVTQRTSSGIIRATADVRGRIRATLFDRSDTVPVAFFTGADPAATQAGYYGFEVYETAEPWSYHGGSLPDMIVADDAHTGHRCLRAPHVDTGTGDGPIATFAAGNQRYVFSCWMRVPAGSNATATNARWQIFRDNESSPFLNLPFPSPGTWTYVSVEIDLIRIAATEVTILGLNESNMEVYADELRFAPQSARYGATVYDSVARRPLARLGDNGWSIRDVLDSTGRVAARFGSGGAMAQTGEAFSRLIVGGDFHPTVPNQFSTITSQAAGLWMRFGRGDAAAWATLPSNWQVSGWRMHYTGTASNPVPPFDGAAVLHGQPLTNFAARVRCEAGAGLRCAGVGLDNLIVYWDASITAWVLGYKNASGNWMSVTKRVAPLGVNWTLAVIDGLVLFWADGAPIFAYAMSPSQAVIGGNLSLYAADPCAFGDLALTVEPRLSIAYADGAGQVVQRLDFADDATVVITGSLTDVLRREYTVRNRVSLPVLIPAPPALPTLPGPEQARVDADLTTYLTDDSGWIRGDGDRLTIAEYLALSPPPFSQVAFENSPLGRVTRVAAPGTALASAHAWACTWAQHTTTDAMAGLGYDVNTGQYQVQTVVDPNGVATYRLENAVGRALAQRVQITGTPTYATTQFFYDDAGRLAKALLPNAFGNTFDPNWAVARTYTFLGQPATITDPDSGEVQCNYDELGRLRYRLDANGAAQTPPLVVYFLYDDLDRLVEEGTIAWAALDFSSIPQYAPYTLPVALSPVWTRRQSWDRNATDPAELNLAGRLWQVQIADPSGTSVESYSYDTAGNVVRHLTAVPGYDANTYETVYSYDALGTRVETTYPRPVSNPGAPFTVGRYFDRLGRIVGVGQGSSTLDVFDPQHPITSSPADEAYARYDYDKEGRLESASYANATAAPISRSYTYDPTSSRLTCIRGDFHTEALTYTSGGFGGVGYWDGKVASAANAVSLRPGSGFAATPVVNSQWAYAYDNLGRLASAEQRSGEANDASLDLGTSGSPMTYDANGNFLSVPRVAASESYAYVTGTDEVSAHTGMTEASQNFAQTNTPGWTWGASNGGPSASAVVASGVGQGKALMLAGGGPGHDEQLVYRGYLDPNGSYQLSYSIKADAAFPAQGGSAGWYLQLHTSAGEELRLPVSDVSSIGTSWQAIGPVTIDVAALASAAGLSAPLVAGGLVLVNGKRGDAQPAAALYVTDIGLSGTGVEQIAYDLNGNVDAAPKLGLTSVTLDPVSNRASSIQLSGSDASAVAYAYGPSGDLALEIVTYPTGTPDKALYLRDPDGRILMRRVTSGGAERITTYLDGPNGIFAEVVDGIPSYLLRDHSDTPRAAVTPGATPVVKWVDYGPFGDQLAAGRSAMLHRTATARRETRVGIEPSDLLGVGTLVAAYASYWLAMHHPTRWFPPIIVANVVYATVQWWRSGQTLLETVGQALQPESLRVAILPSMHHVAGALGGVYVQRVVVNYVYAPTVLQSTLIWGPLAGASASYGLQALDHMTRNWPTWNGWQLLPWNFPLDVPLLLIGVGSGSAHHWKGIHIPTRTMTLADAMLAPYKRPKWGAGFKERVWYGARQWFGFGGVFDPTSGRPMGIHERFFRSARQIHPQINWIIGHMPGYENANMEVSAYILGLGKDPQTGKVDAAEYVSLVLRPWLYRPETPETSVSHRHELGGTGLFLMAHAYRFGRILEVAVLGGDNLYTYEEWKMVNP